MSDDLRSTIEAAASSTPSTPEVSHAAPVQVESPAPAIEAAPVSSEAKSSHSDDAGSAGVSDAPADAPRADAPKSIEEAAGAESKPVADSTETVEEKAARQRVDRAPQSWKGDAKKLWEQLPLQVRQEVARRERDMQVKLQESAQDRQRVQAITEVLTPHRERIERMYGGNPITAINNLLQAEQMLTAAPAKQRAEFVANLIKQYDVDIMALDAALAGAPMPENIQQQSQIEQLLEQRLAPFQQFLQTQQQREAQQRQQVEQQAVMTVEQMAADTEQFPYFQDVREDMADIVELNARKGIYISLPEAYNKAIRMNDDTFRAASVREQHQGQQQAALDAHRAAQAAKGASVSVSGSPAANGRQQLGNASDLRGAIAAAFDGGRL